MSIFFIFWDGVGYGSEDPNTNPFLKAHLPTFTSLFNGNIPSRSFKRFSSDTVSMTPVNTTLGVDGLPQSGTGQTAIMTGVNAPKFIGKHFGPHPYSLLVPVIKEKNLFSKLQQIGKSFFFANGYPKRYFDYIFGPRGKVPTIALSYLSAGKSLNSHIEIIHHQAVSADIAGTRWKELGHPEVPSTEPKEAGRMFTSFGEKYDLVFFEYFLPDHAGHSKDMNMAIEVLERMDGFLKGILDTFDRNNDIVLMISDHGNIEDLSTKSHTRNPVPLIVIGKRHHYFSSRIKKLTDITPTILSYFVQVE